MLGSIHARSVVGGAWQGGQEYAFKGSTKDTFFQKVCVTKLFQSKNLFYGKSSSMS